MHGEYFSGHFSENSCDPVSEMASQGRKKRLGWTWFWPSWSYI